MKLLNKLWNIKKPESKLTQASPVAAKLANNSELQSSPQIEKSLQLASGDIESGRYKILLYRFLTDNIPVVNASVWTWVRLAASEGYYIIDSDNSKDNDGFVDKLEEMSENLSVNFTGNGSGKASFISDLYEFLFRDGFFGGFLTIKQDGTGVDKFITLDPADIYYSDINSKKCLVYDNGDKQFRLDRPDFFFMPLGSGLIYPLGRSILQSIPFVSYIEQQLVDDMRRSSHNSGFHRLHVKVTPPERFAGESETAFVERINKYFDSTVSMIKDCDVADNPVTWNNVEIDSIGPENARSVTNSWFLNHRAMVEEICAGTNLAPFLLGYSYGATTTWSGFKFDLVMRQVKSVQAEVSHFMEWIGNIELALNGFSGKCKFIFDNKFTHKASEDSSVKSAQVDNIIKSLNAGLINKENASRKIRDLL